jgi:hypothetical protein
MKFMSRITVNIRPEQEEQLKAEQRESGAPVSLQVRRALDKYLGERQERQDQGNSQG